MLKMLKLDKVPAENAKNPTQQGLNQSSHDQPKRESVSDRSVENLASINKVK
jgi:hypothetical protein